MKHLLHKLNSLRLLTMLTIMLGVGANRVWADSFTITFKTGSNDGTLIESKTSCSDIVSNGSDYLSGTVVTATKAYHSGSHGLKLGTSSASGVLKVNLASSIKPTSVVVNAKRYNTSKDATLAVNSKTAQSLSSDFTDYTFSYNGNTSISYIQLDASKYCWIASVTVNYENAKSATYLTLNKATTSLTANGATEALTATVTPEGGGTLDSPTIKWTSSDETVATVTAGVITPLKEGTTTITASYAGDDTYAESNNTCIVTVTDAREAVNLSTFTATSTTLIKGAYTTTSVTNDQADWTAAYTYTSSNPDVATVDANGVVTAIAKGTATITCSLNVSQSDAIYKPGTTSSKSIEITVNNPSHTATFSSNGSTFDTPVTVEEGEAITFPATNPTNINGYSFVGWAEATIDGTTQTAPSFVTSATMGENDVTYYAVFAQVTQGNLTTVTDVLTRTTTGVTGQSYSDWSGKTATSSAVYAGNSAGGNESIQIRTENNNSGIITTASGGRATKVSVVWHSKTGSDRTITIYGKSTAFESPANLYTGGTKNGYTLGEITNGTTELTLAGNYPYIGIRSKSGALYLTSISITWANGTPDTYSNYCTTVSALPIPVITMSDVTMDFGETGKSVAPTATIGEESYSGAFTYSVDADGLTVGADGSLTSSTPGTYTVTATIAGTETYQTASATCTVSVRKQPTMPATSEQTVAYGETYTLSLEGADCGDVTLTSSNTDVATVDGLTATPVAVGTTTITVNAAADATHTAGTTSFTLTVEQPSPNTSVVGDFVHVTSTNDVTDGKYLIVYEYGPVAFNGSLETLDVAENKISIDHSNNAIINTAAMSAVSFTITAVDGGYTIKSASGYYIGQTSNANGLASSTETPYTNTISIDNGNADISSAGAYLRYNKDSGQKRFRYFKSSTYTDQQAIQLYKASTTGSESVTLNSAGYLAYASANPMDFSTATGFSAWQITAIEGSTITFERITTAIAGGQGVLLKGDAGATISIPLKESTTKLTGNKLAATLAPTYFADETIYGLNGNQFYLNEPCTLKANRAYIPASEVPAQAQGAKGFTLVFADQETGITETQDATLQPAATIYNLAGQRMSHPQRGINIIGGRKVVVK